MSTHQRFKGFKRLVKEKVHQVFTSGSDSVLSTGSAPDVPSSTIDPASATSTASTASVFMPRAMPTSSGDPAAIGTWACLGGLLRILAEGSRVFGPLKTAVDGLAQCIAIYENAAATRREYETLKTELEELFSTLGTHFADGVPPTMTASMDSLCSAIEKELDQISSKEERGVGRRHLEAEKDLDEVMECYRRIHGYLERVMLNADLSTWRIVDEQATENRLKSLAPSLSAYYNSAEAAMVRRRECTPKTREQILADLSGWRHDQNQGKIYWLNGMAGTGKTTIASSFCAMLDRSHELGASFFCTRQLPECRNVKFILPTIAYQLARFSRPFCCALSNALERDPDLHARALPNQLEGMIVGPLRVVARTLPVDLVIVIDALDECADSGGVGQILEMLVKHASELPIKVFVSSRPEPQIRRKIGSMKSQLVLHELDDKIVKADIETYLRAELTDVLVSESQLADLVSRAGVLFIYAATAVRYIQAEDFHAGQQKRLNTVLGTSSTTSSNKNKDIDALYNTVLASAFANPELEDSDKEQMRLVLWTVVCAQEPLTVSALAGLLQLDSGDWVHAALRLLWSVLHISGADSSVTTLHASFPDYILDPQRSKGDACDAGAHHGRLTELCFERIRHNELQFNVCELESSYIPDEQVSNIEDKVNQAIPLDLAYACQYWAVHLEQGGPSNSHMQLLGEFLSTRVLLWMEVLNLKRRIKVGAKLLERARMWCTNQDCPQDTRDLLHDAWQFVTTFATNSVSRSTPHIYVSMLASWPRSRPIADRYIRRTKHLVKVAGTAMTKREFALLGVFAASDEVQSVAFSPDGMRIASGSWDKTIRVWDAQSGEMMLGPLEGHTHSVNSVAFSSNGMQIVSGSADNTLRVWDAQSGLGLLRPLRRHIRPVYSVAFSPDDTRIVSGSGDTTICVWDAQSGEMILGPLVGHSNSVISVMFSPEGTRIVSSSTDKTICVWDAHSGQSQVVLGPLEESVISVAFSPDGTRIVSGGNDNMVRVWDARGGQIVLGPLEGHTQKVTSVAFSPEDTRIVSGSEDKTIRVWDSQNGQMILGPLEGHTDKIHSIAFSPDGMRIVSGSRDKTVRVWDAQGRHMMLEPLKGHTDRVNAVAFSPSGRHIVSGSWDKTICVWHLQSGEMVLGPLRHTSIVLSVTFSPDGTRIVSSGSNDTVCVWDAQSGQTVLGPLEGHTSWVSSVTYSPDGTRMVSGSEDGKICMWDACSGQMVLGPLEGHADSVQSVAFSPDGKRIVSGSGDKTIRLWDAHSGQMVLEPIEGHTDRVNAVAFSSDGMNIVSGSYDKTICMWELRSGSMTLGPLQGHTSWVSSVALSPDGTQIVSGSGDKTVRLWDARSGEVLGLLEGHTHGVKSVAFSPDGTHIASASNDETIRVWRVPRNQVVNQASSTRVPPSDSPTHAPHLAPSSSWRLDEDGWILDNDQNILLWVPHDLRGIVTMPLNTLLISTRGSVELNFDHANIGESWADCYLPA